MTGIPRLDKLAFADRTCEARSVGSRAQSYNGSEPNWSTRVTNFAFGFERRILKSASRRVFQILGLSHPNCQLGYLFNIRICYVSEGPTQISAWTPIPAPQAASMTSLLHGKVRINDYIGRFRPHTKIHSDRRRHTIERICL